MSGTVRTQAALYALLPDNVINLVDPVDIRDIVATLFARTGGILTPNIQTANYTFALADIDTWVWMNLTGTANTLTVPPNASVAFGVGQMLSFGMFGTGVTTITPGAGVTINTTSSLVLARHQSGVLYQIQANVWECST